jgi:hypothetical protein
MQRRRTHMLASLVDPTTHGVAVAMVNTKGKLRISSSITLEGVLGFPEASVMAPSARYVATLKLAGVSMRYTHLSRCQHCQAIAWAGHQYVTTILAMEKHEAASIADCNWASHSAHR